MFRQFDRFVVLDPTEKDISVETYDTPTANPFCFLLPEKAEQERKKNNSRKDQVNDEDKIPGEPVFIEGGKNHGPIGCQEIENDMTDQDRKTDLIKTPEAGTL